jgi:hypothetical protein
MGVAYLNLYIIWLFNEAFSNGCRIEKYDNIVQRPFGLLRSIKFWLYTTVLEEHFASILRAKLRSFKK